MPLFSLPFPLYPRNLSSPCFPPPLSLFLFFSVLHLFFPNIERKKENMNFVEGCFRFRFIFPPTYKVISSSSGEKERRKRKKKKKIKHQNIPHQPYILYHTIDSNSNSNGILNITFIRIYYHTFTSIHLLIHTFINKSLRKTFLRLKHPAFSPSPSPLPPSPLPLLSTKKNFPITKYHTIDYLPHTNKIIIKSFIQSSLFFPFSPPFLFLFLCLNPKRSKTIQNDQNIKQTKKLKHTQKKKGSKLKNSFPLSLFLPFSSSRKRNKRGKKKRRDKNKTPRTTRSVHLFRKRKGRGGQY